MEFRCSIGSVSVVTYEHFKGHFYALPYESAFLGEKWEINILAKEPGRAIEEVGCFEYCSMDPFPFKEFVWINITCIEKTGSCYYINITECTITPGDVSIKLDIDNVSAWIYWALLLCHPSLQGISQQFYKKNISVPSILTIILICLNWHSPVDSLFKSYTHYYVFIP